MLSSGAKVIIWDKMLSSKANVIMVSSGANVIIWDDNTPLFVFPGNFTHSYTINFNNHIRLDEINSKVFSFSVDSGDASSLNTLKVHKHEIFFLTFFAETESLWSQGPVTRDFLKSYSIRPRYSTFKHFGACSACDEIGSQYAQHAMKLVPRMLSVR
jgi:hypothetical protein